MITYPKDLARDVIIHEVWKQSLAKLGCSFMEWTARIDHNHGGEPVSVTFTRKSAEGLHTYVRVDCHVSERSNGDKRYSGLYITATKFHFSL